MITFPGFTDLANLKEWYDKTYDPISEMSKIVWGVFNTISTMVTIVGIYKIMKTLHQLKMYNLSLKTNYFQLTLHALVLTFNLIPVIVICLPDDWLNSHQWIIIDFILIVTDTMS